MENNEIKNFLAYASNEEINKIKKLIENKKLATNFMDKPEFIADVKEIFKSELNIEINDEDVKHLLQNIEKAANNEPLEALSEENLEKAAGGVSLKGIRDTAIIGVSSFIGGAIGFAGGAASTASVANYLKGSTEINLINLGSAVAGAFVGNTAGALAGAAIGRKIVNYLNK